jgi:hypothetical protein
MTPYDGLLVPEFVVFPIRVIAEPVAFDEIIEPEVVGLGASEIANPWNQLLVEPDDEPSSQIASPATMLEPGVM